MPDRNRERFTRIGGRVYETTDAAIQERVDRLRLEIPGVPSPQVTIEGQTVLLDTEMEGRSKLPKNVMVFQEKSLPSDSPVHIFEVKSQLNVARNTNDSEAFREIKKAA